MINLLEAPVSIYKQCKDPRKIKEHQETLNNPSTKASASFIHGPTRDVLQEEDFSSFLPLAVLLLMTALFATAMPGGHEAAGHKDLRGCAEVKGCT